MSTKKDKRFVEREGFWDIIEAIWGEIGDLHTQIYKLQEQVKEINRIPEV